MVAMKYDRAVVTEAKKQVRLWVKDMLKKKGVKISSVKAGSIIKAVNKIMVEHGDDWCKLAAREIKRLERQEAKMARQTKWS
jgi:hypothetical protein